MCSFHSEIGTTIQQKLNLFQVPDFWEFSAMTNVDVLTSLHLWLCWCRRPTWQKNWMHSVISKKLCPLLLIHLSFKILGVFIGIC